MSIQMIAMGLKPAALWLQATDSGRLTAEQKFELGREALQHPNPGGILRRATCSGMFFRHDCPGCLAGDAVQTERG